MNTLDLLFTFKPIYKSVLWGGTRIPRLKGEQVMEDMHIGESWEISGLPGNLSVVASGPYIGTALPDLMARLGADLMGTAWNPDNGNKFPLLVKFIDACRNLSVQVHPNDRLAASRHNKNGKNELWYVIDTEPGSRIICGLSRSFSPEEYDAHQGRLILDALASYPACRGQFYYIPSGTIHALGAGTMVAEIQQSSDITYRIYDYDRRDADGRPRQLHTDLARMAIDYTFPATAEPVAKTFHNTCRDVVTTPNFVTDIFHLTRGSQPATLDTGRISFNILMATEGSVKIKTPANEHTLTAGHTILIPAAAPPYTISGNGVVLRIRLQ